MPPVTQTRQTSVLVHLPNTFGDAPTNMAIDAALLESLPERMAVFRHYGWTEPAATFGYAQRYTEVRALLGEEIQLCRRMTGGGIVDHRDDWTYALILKADIPAARSAATELYATLHRCIQTALAYQDVASILAPCSKQCGTSVPKSSTPARPDQCFIQPAANDVLRPDGTKIAGAAMKRNRHGLLVQGSINRSGLPEDFDFARLSRVLREQLAIALEIPLYEPDDVRPLFDGGKIQQARQQFADDTWTRRR